MPWQKSHRVGVLRPFGWLDEGDRERVFEKEGAVTGIYPSGSFAEDLPPIVTGSSTYTEFYTDTREEQTQQLLEMSDAYLVLPGGFGTLEELSSVCSIATLGPLSGKPIGVLMTEGLTDGLKPLLKWLKLPALLGLNCLKRSFSI